MIGQTKKPLREILEFLEGKERVVIWGCGGCASVFGTGGRREVRQLAEALSQHGKEVVAAVGVPPGEFTCHAPSLWERLKGYKEELKACQAVVVLACGDGLQVLQETLEEGFGLSRPVYPGVNTQGLMGGGPVSFQEKCRQCGECLLGEFAGICPLTRCPKGLLNGPCGGAKDGKCEVDRGLDCAWLSIYQRLKVLGKLEGLTRAPLFKDYAKEKRPRSLKVGQEG